GAGRDANNPDRLAGRKAPALLRNVAEWARAVEEPARERFVDDRDERRARAIGGRKVAAGKNRCAERCEPARRHHVAVRATLAIGERHAARYFEVSIPALAFGWPDQRPPGLPH